MRTSVSGVCCLKTSCHSLFVIKRLRNYKINRYPADSREFPFMGHLLFDPIIELCRRDLQVHFLARSYAFLAPIPARREVLYLR